MSRAGAAGSSRECGSRLKGCLNEAVVKQGKD